MEHPVGNGIPVMAGGVKQKKERAMAEIFHRVWPSAAIAVGLGVTVVWMAVFGYGLFKLGELAF